MKSDLHLKEILGLSEVSQIGIVVRDIEKAMSNYSGIFGITFSKVFVPDFSNKTYRGKPSDFRIKVAFGMMGELQIELIQVLQGKTIYDEFLERNAEGLHHLGFDVKNIDERIAALQTLGVGVLQSGEKAGAKFAYLDTESMVGVIFELIERDKKM